MNVVSSNSIMSSEEAALVYNAPEDNYVNYSWMKERPRRSSSKSKPFISFITYLLISLKIHNRLEKGQEPYIFYIDEILDFLSPLPLIDICRH